MPVHGERAVLVLLEPGNYYALAQKSGAASILCRYVLVQNKKANLQDKL